MNRLVITPQMSATDMMAAIQHISVRVMMRIVEDKGWAATRSLDAIQADVRALVPPIVEIVTRVVTDVWLHTIEESQS